MEKWASSFAVTRARIAEISAAARRVGGRLRAARTVVEGAASSPPCERAVARLGQPDDGEHLVQRDHFLGAVDRREESPLVLCAGQPGLVEPESRKGEQREGNFLHRIRAGGLGGLGRAAARLNDHAEDLAERLTALPASVRSCIGASMDVRIAEGRPLRLRLSDITDIRLALFLFSVATEVAAAFLPL